MLSVQTGAVHKYWFCSQMVPTEIFVYRRESILKLSIICEQLVLVMEQQENVTLLQNVHPEGGLVAALVVMVLESVAILFRYEERSC